MFRRKPAPPVPDPLPSVAVLRVLGCLAVVIGPHLPRLPGWALALVLFVIGWRAASALRQWPSPPGWLRIGVALAAFGGVYISFGRVSGQTAGVALLSVMAALKLTELRALRDLRVMVFLMYFMLVTHFLFSQELWTAAYLLVCTALITALLIDANHPGRALPLRLVIGMGGRTVLQALPLMVLIFVLFPRIPGPLWGLPSDSGAARSGLSDSMAPGEISRLVESDELAFRVRFDGEPPPARERYWRGPVFLHFDGRRWEPGSRPREAMNAVARLEGPVIGYEVTLEPMRTGWLFALDLPSPLALPSDAVLNADYQLVLAKGEVRERKLYRVSSQTRYQLQPELPPRLRALSLQLPRGFNPRAVELAQSWRAQGLEDAAIVDTALHRFREQDYHYSLHPPALGRHSVDEFLFDTRSGFCEHYASSFTVLMRAAGIPARIVTGYQGGERNAVGDYYRVRQSDAHAWAEVWLEGRGWVRVDPTAWVAPERVERGIGEALAGSDRLPAFLDPARRSGFRFNLAARWDWVNAQWSHWVLGYGPDLQREFLSRFGLVDWGEMILALTVGLSLLLGITGLLWLRRTLPKTDEDAAALAWRRMQTRIGLPAHTGEGPRDYVARAAEARPELATALRAALEEYLGLRYLAPPSAARPKRIGQVGSGLRKRRRA